jgi:hypothetical protein
MTMPDLSELDLARVRQILAKAGVRLGNISEMYHDTIARGYICGQFPTPGAAFTRGEPDQPHHQPGPTTDNDFHCSVAVATAATTAHVQQCFRS